MAGCFDARHSAPFATAEAAAFSLFTSKSCGLQRSRAVVLPAPKKEFVIKSVGPDHFTVPIPAVTETPLMKQYYQLKQQHPGAVLLFRVGDFYETFGEDAVTASRILDITLTKRGGGSPNEIALAGFPHKHHAKTHNGRAEPSLG